MTWLRRLAYLVRQSRHDADLREEIEAHRALRAAQLERDGMSPVEAAVRSRRAIGNVLLARDDAREVWLGSWDTWWQDVRYGLRILRQTMRPVAVGAIAGIAAAVAVSRVLSGVLFGVSPADPIGLAGAAALVISVALAAAVIAARPATLADPTITLRAE